MTNKTLLLLTYIFFFLTTSLIGQKYSYIQYHDDYLSPFSSAESVFQDSTGYLWIGGQEGLFRFDGKHFENYSESFKSRHIYTINEHFFISDGGLFSINLYSQPQVERVLIATLEESDTSLYFPIDFLQDENDVFWIGQSNHTIVRYDKGQLQKFPLPKQSIATEIHFHEDHRGNLWTLSSVDGLYIFNKQKQQFENKYKIENARVIYGKDELLWIGGKDLQVFRIDDRNRLRLLKRWDIEGADIQSIAQNEEGQYLIGTNGKGLFLLNDEKAQPQKIFGSNDPHRIDELEFGDIADLLVLPNSIGENGTIWVAASTGLWLLQEKYFNDIPNLPRSAARSITFGKDESVWVSFGDLYHINKGKEEFTASFYDYDTQIGATLFHENKLWFSTSDYDILVLQNRQLLQKYDLSERGEGIFYLYADSRDNVWFCQAPSEQPIVGIAKITPNQKIELYEEDKGFESRILVLKESNRGELYAAGIGTTTYLYRYEAEQDRFVNISLPIAFKVRQNFEVHDMAIDDRGIIWLATTDGLLIYDGEKVRRTSIPILSEEVRSVCIAGNNSIWAATATDGLIYFDNLDNHYVAFNESSGLPSVVNSYRCLRRDAKNRVWVCTAEGVVYSSGKMIAPPTSAMPKFRQFIIGDKIIEPVGTLAITDNNNLQVKYQSLAYPGDKALYQYRIIAKEEATFINDNQLWNKASNETIFSTSELPIGAYLIQIRAKERGGYQWSTINSVELSVRQVWYKKWWVITAALGLVIFLFGGYIRLFLLKRLQYLEKLLSKQQEELAAQESVIQNQSETLGHQQEELQEAMSNIATLHLIISQVEPNSKWDELILAVGKAIDQSIGIDAFEIAYQKEEEIVYNGYSSKEKDGITYRSKKFNPKTSLTCYAIAFQREILINDFEKEHIKYIEKKNLHLFHSMSFTPFLLSNGRSAVLCAYHMKKNQFSEHDVLMLKVLSDYLCLCAADELD